MEEWNWWCWWYQMEKVIENKWHTSVTSEIRTGTHTHKGIERSTRRHMCHSEIGTHFVWWTEDKPIITSAGIEVRFSQEGSSLRWVITSWKWILLRTPRRWRKNQWRARGERRQTSEHHGPRRIEEGSPRIMDNWQSDEVHRLTRLLWNNIADRHRVCNHRVQRSCSWSVQSGSYVRRCSERESRINGLIGNVVMSLRGFIRSIRRHIQISTQ